MAGDPSCRFKIYEYFVTIDSPFQANDETDQDLLNGIMSGEQDDDPVFRQYREAIEFAQSRGGSAFFEEIGHTVPSAGGTIYRVIALMVELKNTTDAVEWALLFLGELNE